MVFSSYGFIFIFLPIVILGYYLLSKLNALKFQHVFLILMSMIFYGYFNIYYLPIILSSIFVNYVIGKKIQSETDLKMKKIIFIIGIVFNVGLLGYYKYYDFFATNINILFQSDIVLKNLMLPLGISFFTFQQFSFLLSIYKGEEQIEGIIDYTLFVSFFPQLVAGPIVTYSEMIPQFKDKKTSCFCEQNFSEGVFIFVLGLFKKIVIADTLAIFANNGFSMTADLGLAAAWLTSLSYTFQIYFDFSGYSDMAIGLGKMLNINLPINFNSPYKSKSISEFWRRWHITLGRALSKFIYIPLGGNKKHVYRNLLITFFISGLWHGAGWTFILWGLIHGIFTVLERVFKKVLVLVPNVIRVITTFLIVNFAWVLFRANNMNETLNIYRAMFKFNDLNLSQLGQLPFDSIINFPNSVWILYLLLCLLISGVLIFFRPNVLELNEKFKTKRVSAMMLSIVFVIAVIHLSKTSIFIYFNF